jgi:hypothetical protein
MYSHQSPSQNHLIPSLSESNRPRISLTDGGSRGGIHLGGNTVSYVAVEVSERPPQKSLGPCLTLGGTALVRQSLRSTDPIRAVLFGEGHFRRNSYRRNILWYTPSYVLASPYSPRSVRSPSRDCHCSVLPMHGRPARPVNRTRGGIKWGLVAHTAAMFSFVTIYTAIASTSSPFAT